jgi:hypothetical protein
LNAIKIQEMMKMRVPRTAFQATMGILGGTSSSTGVELVDMNRVVKTNQPVKTPPDGGKRAKFVALFVLAGATGFFRFDIYWLLFPCLL